MWLRGTPHVIEVAPEKPLVNFRAWKLHCRDCWYGRVPHEEHVPLLISLYAFGTWPPGEQTAEDPLKGNYDWSGGSLVPRTLSPGHGTHGFYAMRRLRELFQRIRDHEPLTENYGGVFPHLIFGKCEQWGWAVRYDDGVRSQHARVSRLYVPPNRRQFLEPLAREYEVPVSVRKFPVSA